MENEAQRIEEHVTGAADLADWRWTWGNGGGFARVDCGPVRTLLA
jgi:hypothetical protein